MAKKAKAETVEVAPQEEVVKTAPTVKQTKPSWEIKDRIYYLKGNKTPLTYTIPSVNILKSMHCFILMKKLENKEKLNMLQIKTLPW